MAAHPNKIKDLHTVRFRLKDGTEKVYRYHRRTRRKIHSEPGTRAFRAEFARAGGSEQGWKRPKAKDRDGRKRSGFVYFVAAHDLGLVKIGWAKDVKRRILSMQSGSPVDLCLIHAFAGVPMDEARMHGQFAHLRVKREWFRLTDEIYGIM